MPVLYLFILDCWFDI